MFVIDNTNRERERLFFLRGDDTFADCVARVCQQLSLLNGSERVGGGMIRRVRAGIYNQRLDRYECSRVRGSLRRHSIFRARKHLIQCESREEKERDKNRAVLPLLLTAVGWRKTGRLSDIVVIQSGGSCRISPPARSAGAIYHRSFSREQSTSYFTLMTFGIPVFLGLAIESVKLSFYDV